MRRNGESLAMPRSSAVSRRRAVTLIGAAAGLPLLSGPTHAGFRRQPPVFEWHGRALGAEARLTLAHASEAVARRAASLCLAEIARLEKVFSLFDEDSEISRLNRDGRLEAPSLDMRLVLVEALRMGALSSGAFDVTVQPLWRLYARHFGSAGTVLGPTDRAIAAAQSRIDYRRLDLDAGRIRFARPGMAVTLNGIAQGYITDRAADLLRDAGFDRVLVQLGEIRALGRPDAGQAWRVAVPTPGITGTSPATVELANQAIATSHGPATVFEPSGSHHHIFDPGTGRSAPGGLSVSVIAARATLADALSTAFAVTGPEKAQEILNASGNAEALFVLPDGGVRHVR